MLNGLTFEILDIYRFIKNTFQVNCYRGLPCSVVKMQTAVTPYLKREHLQLFAFEQQIYYSREISD